MSISAMNVIENYKCKIVFVSMIKKNCKQAKIKLSCSRNDTNLSTILQRVDGSSG